MLLSRLTEAQVDVDRVCLVIYEDLAEILVSWGGGGNSDCGMRISDCGVMSRGRGSSRLLPAHLPAFGPVPSVASVSPVAKKAVAGCQFSVGDLRKSL